MNVESVSVFWTRGTGFVSRRIQSADWCVWHGKRYKAAINHVGLRFRFSGGPDLVSESHLGPGVQIIPFDHIDRARALGKISWYYETPLAFDPGVRQEVWTRAASATGEPYGTMFILRYWMAARFTGKRRPVVGASRLQKRAKTCNVHVVSVVEPFVLEINRDAYHWTPEALFQLWVGRPSAVVYAEAMRGGAGQNG